MFRFGVLSEPFAKATGLSLLPLYADTIAYSVGAFFGVQLLSRVLSPIVYPPYRTFPRKTRNSWDIRVVSMANCSALLPLVARCFRVNGSLAFDKAFATHPEPLRLSAIATGYFLWDTVIEASRGEATFVLHGLSTLCIFLFSFRPFVLYFAPISLVYELSTPFLNIHWFLDKTNRTGTTFQLINGILLLSTFFGARIVYGTYESYDLLRTVWNVRDRIPGWLAFVYLIGNPILNLLNIYWFIKMISAMRKRFPKKEEDIAKGPDPAMPKS